MSIGFNAMNLKFRACTPRELPTIIKRLDKEFIINKQRSISLQKRFPITLSLRNSEQIRVAVSAGIICGALAIRMFNWVDEQQAWNGAMIGMVWVDSQKRGKGIGTKLLASAMQFLHDKDVDFGVLWTGVPAFYERVGWYLNDRGLFGEVKGASSSQDYAKIQRKPLVAMDTEWIECLRSKWLPRRVIRRPRDYCTIPIPADRVMCYFIQSNIGNEGFALVGEQNGTGYLYEMVAPPGCWGILWFPIVSQYKLLYVNGELEDSLSQWLSDQTCISWKSQGKAMWLQISDRITSGLMHTWHIPYFDWI